MSIDISIIVPVYMAEKYLHDCVDSIIAQTVFSRCELILINDGSTDNSLKICNEYASEYNNIFVIHQENAGVSAARNTGIKKASGKYIGFVDSDDYIYPDMYELLLEALERSQSDLSFCGFKQSCPEGETDMLYPFSSNRRLDSQYITANFYPYIMKEESFNACWNKLFRKCLIDKNHLSFDTGRTIGEDRIFTIRYLSNCTSVYYVPYIGYYYRYVQTSAIQSPRKDYIENMVSQYHEDFEFFIPLGFKRDYIEKISGMKMLAQSTAGISSAENKLKGQERRSVIKKIIYNRELRCCLKRNWEMLMLECTRYERLLFIMIKLKSVTGLRTVMRLMQLKIRCAGDKML